MNTLKVIILLASFYTAIYLSGCAGGSAYLKDPATAHADLCDPLLIAAACIATPVNCDTIQGICALSGEIISRKQARILTAATKGHK